MSDERRVVGPYQPEELVFEQPAPTGPREVLPCSACNGEGTVSDMAWDGRETLYECPDCQGHGAFDVESQRPVDLTAFLPRLNATAADRDSLVFAAGEKLGRIVAAMARLDAFHPDLTPVTFADEVRTILGAAPPVDDPWTSPIPLADQPDRSNP